MKALFVAPDLTVIASLISSSATVDEFIKSADEYTPENYSEKSKDAHTNPAFRRFSWVKFDKTEEDVDFFSNIAMLSANNSYTSAEKDILMTQDSVFVNINILDAFKEIANTADGESVNMDLDLSSRMTYDAFKEIAYNMYDDGSAKFHEIVSTDNGPQLFMLTGEFTNDTWSVLEGIGVVARKSVLMQKDTDCKTTIPGFCLLFGLSMSALAQIASRLDVFPEHIKADFEKLPRNEENA